MNNWEIDNQYGYQTAVQAENELTLRRYTAGVMRKVYGKMALGLLATAVTSFLMLSNPVLLQSLFSVPATMWILLAAELGLVIYLSARIDRLSTGVATTMFYAYSILNGVTMTPIFLAYTGVSIATTFAITAGTFGAMTIFGYVTRQDLSKVGSYLFMALIGLIVCSLVNFILRSPMMDLLVSCAGVLIFVGLIAWDAQAIKRMCAETDPSMLGKVSTMAALTVYLDFINLFLFLLRFFGSRD